MIKPYYQDSAVTIYHGDCRQIVPVLGKFDLLLTDPPYGIDAGNRKRIASRANAAAARDYGDNEWDLKPAESSLIDELVAKAEHSIIWGGNYFRVAPSAGWLVWDKQNTGDFADGELAWTNLDMAVRIFRLMWNGMLRAGESRGVPRVHPTQKPVELMRWCLQFVPESRTILDPFMGSGTTLRASKDLNKLHCIGIELEERYCEIAAKRMAQEVLPL